MGRYFNFIRKAILQGTLNAGLIFTLSDDGTYYIFRGGKIEGNEVIVPETYEDLPVKEIGENAFQNAHFITSIKLPNTITKINDYAFYDCRNLLSIEMSSNIEYIGEGAFSQCSKLSSIELPDSLTYIGNSAFSYSGLTKINIPNSVTYLGQYAFSHCTELSNVELSNNLSTIEYFTFNTCTSLQKVKIPEGVNSIGAYAFDNCNSLTHFEIPKSLKKVRTSFLSSYGATTTAYYYGTIEDLCNIDFPRWIDSFFGTFEYFNMLDENGEWYEPTEIYIPSNVQRINYAVFANAEKITSVEIASGVYNIEGYAFYRCSELRTVKIPKTVTTIGDYVFSWCNKLEKIYCEADSKPSNWSDSWLGYSTTIEVIWGYTG